MYVHSPEGLKMYNIFQYAIDIVPTGKYIPTFFYQFKNSTSNVNCHSFLKWKNRNLITENYSTIYLMPAGYLLKTKLQLL